MVRGRRIDVGEDPVDLAKGTRQSGVQIQAIRNRGKTDLWIGAVGNGYVLEPGESLPSGIMLGSTDSLTVVRKRGSGPVDLIIGYDEIFVEPENA